MAVITNLIKNSSRFREWSHFGGSLLLFLRCKPYKCLIFSWTNDKTTQMSYRVRLKNYKYHKNVSQFRLESKKPHEHYKSELSNGENHIKFSLSKHEIQKNYTNDYKRLRKCRKSHKEPYNALLQNKFDAPPKKLSKFPSKHARTTHKHVKGNRFRLEINFLTYL